VVNVLISHMAASAEVGGPPRLKPQLFKAEVGGTPRLKPNFSFSDMWGYALIMLPCEAFYVRRVQSRTEQRLTRRATSLSKCVIYDVIYDMCDS
jgi:hypothetical protein